MCSKLPGLRRSVRADVDLFCIQKITHSPSVLFVACCSGRLLMPRRTHSPSGYHPAHIKETASGCLSVILLAWQRSRSTFFSTGYSYLGPRWFTSTLKRSDVISAPQLNPRLNFPCQYLVTDSDGSSHPSSSRRVLHPRHVTSAGCIFPSTDTRSASERNTSRV